MSIDSHTAALLLAVPVSDAAVVDRMASLSATELLGSLTGWLEAAENVGWLQLRAVTALSHEVGLRVELDGPAAGVALFHLLSRTDQASVDAVRERARRLDSPGTLHVAVCVVPPVEAEVMLGVEARLTADDLQWLLIDPDWAAALLVEQMKPFLHVPGIGEKKLIPRADAPYFDTSAVTELRGLGLDVMRSSSRYRALSTALVEDSVGYEEKLRTVKRDVTPFEGTVLLATVFLPPITHAQSAVERFYRSWHGMRAERLNQIGDRYRWERRVFEEHIATYRRIDLVDRSVLQEYLAAPEYYQMLLTVEELREQIDNALRLMEYDNYSLVLCPESIDLSFEVRGDEVRLRSDRRNKGQPRQGRVSSLLFRSAHLAEVFEREFWTLYRSTEPYFKDKGNVGRWLHAAAGRYRGPASL